MNIVWDKTQQSDNEFAAEVKTFVDEFLSDTECVSVCTSGSTGTPKVMAVEKKRMQASARATCRFLQLKAGQTALLCMPMRYIAGKMMAVRALEVDMQLICVAPSARPLKDIDQHIDFAAMTPMQVHETLRQPLETERLKRIDNLIIGGGAVDDELATTLRQFPLNVYSTYGMTETLSHIAMRRLSGPNADLWYTPLEGVTISLSTYNTLTINAPEVCPDELTTNDIAELDAGKFRILGRRDNTVNSGGIKVQMEEVERVLRPHIHCLFAVTAVPDKRLGEAVAVIAEQHIDLSCVVEK